MVDELKRMSDRELAQRMLDYIDRAHTLMQHISDFLERKATWPSRDDILFDYKRLKEAIKTDAHYVDLVRNHESRSKIYRNFFVSSIAEASVYGFTAPVNSKIDQRFYRSVSEAYYKLTKYYSRDEWIAIAEL